MDKLELLLNERMGAEPSSKVKALAKQSAQGQLTSFSGLFQVGELPEGEKKALETLLREYDTGSNNFQNDLSAVVSITSEVKAIHNQAALLHGERIKRVQTILKNYKEGAFTAWLLHAYGNRQTPYNFLLYFEFVESLPLKLKQKIDSMPRQAVYALASRRASIEKKQEMVEYYEGQSKKEMLELIRTTFPLDKDDKRRTDEGETILEGLQSLLFQYKRKKREINKEKRQAIKELLQQFAELIS